MGLIILLIMLTNLSALICETNCLVVFTYSLSSVLYLAVWSKNYVFSFSNVRNRMQSGSF